MKRAVGEPRGKEDHFESLRDVRESTTQWIEETEAKRNPAPAISRSKVEALSEAYAAWTRDVDAQGASRPIGVGSVLIPLGMGNGIGIFVWRCSRSSRVPAYLASQSLANR